MTQTPTNFLAKVREDDISGSDLLRLWSNKFGGEAAMSLTILSDWLSDNLTPTPFAPALVTQYDAPTVTGFTSTVNVANTWLVLTPAGAYADGAIALPFASHGDEVLVSCTQSVTALVVTAQAGDSQVGAPTTLAANDFFRMKYDDVLNRWYRVG